MTALAVEPAAPLLEVRNLHTAFAGAQGSVMAAAGVSFSLGAGETKGLVGESGSGKSVTLLSLLGLVPEPGCVVDGEVLWDGRDLLRLSAAELRDIRGREIAMIFQDPTSCLNPVYTIGEQIAETLRVKLGMGGRAAKDRAAELLDHVGIPAARSRLGSYPHELSGGMRQRVMIAIAIACRPRLLLADEPTTALDVTIQDQILALLADLQQEFGMAMVLVSHDLGVVAQNCDSVAVMYAGHVVEHAPADGALPQRRATRTRSRCCRRCRRSQAPGRAGASRRSPARRPTSPQLPEGCPFRPRCPSARDACAGVTMELLPVGPAAPDRLPVHGGDAHDATLLDVENLVKRFELRRPVSSRLGRRPAPALTRGRRRLALARAPPHARDRRRVGQRQDDARALHHPPRRARRGLGRLRRHRADVARRAATSGACGGGSRSSSRIRTRSLNPRMTVGATIAEPLRVHGLAGRDDAPGEGRRAARPRRPRARRSRAASRASSPAASASASRSRAASPPQPELLIADEAVSALDVSVQAQILNLLLDLTEHLGLTMIFISHQLVGDRERRRPTSR